MRAGAALAASLLLVALVVAGCGGSAAPARQPPIVTRAWLDPPMQLFAEPVVAHLDLTVNPKRLDPTRISVKTDFAPYDVIGATRKRDDLGGLTRFRYAFTLRCLLIECVPKIIPSAAGEAESGRGERVTFTFHPAKILYRDAKKPRTVGRVAWPKLDSASRINFASIPAIGFLFKDRVTPLPAATYRIAPALLAVLLLLAACGLLAFPAVLLWRWWRGRRPVVVEEEAPEIPPLERALRVVEWAAAREDGPETREALELLAFELEAGGSEPLAGTARRIAWSPPAPSRPEAEELVESVRRSNGHVG